MSKPRVYLHDDGRVLSIGFDDTNDTLLALPDAGYDPIVDRDRGDMKKLREWVEAVDVVFEIVADMTSGETSPCRFDHHGYCQEHGWLDESECPIARARRLGFVTTEGDDDGPT